MQDQVLTPWMFRRWRFEFPSELYPAVLERLRGTPARVREFIGSYPAEAIGRVPGEGWSVLRHIGHLADLERLFSERLDAYEAGVHELPAADMSNVRTTEAQHDDADAQALVTEFARVRTESVDRLCAYPRDFFARSAWHARLGIQKRVVDTCVFFADHDDHHLALMRHVTEGGS